MNTTVDYIIGKVKGFHIANMTLAKWKLNYDRVRKEFWQTIGAIAVVVALLFLFGGDSDTPTTGKADNGTVIKATATEQPDDFIEQACREYEAETGRKIYPKGRECIRKKAVEEHLSTVNDVYILIVENAKFMWKDEPIKIQHTQK